MGTVEIRGKKVMLRATTQDDLSNIRVLWNDGRVMKWVGSPDGLGYSANDMQKWFDNLQTNPDRHHFVVYSERGFCGEVYYAVDRPHKRAGLDIKFVSEAQGQGLATDALMALIKHVFTTETDIREVWTEPSEENTAARKLYSRCGLRPQNFVSDRVKNKLHWILSRKSWNGG